MRSLTSKHLRDFTSFFFPALIIRVVTVWSVDPHQLTSSIVLRGLLSDGMVALAISFPFLFLPSVLILPALFLWCFLLASNKEFIIVNGANLSPDFLMAGDQTTFVRGSVFVLPILGWTVALFLTSLLAFRSVPTILPKWSVRPLSLITVTGGLLALLWPPSVGYPTWVSESALEDLVRQRLRSSASHAHASLSETEEDTLRARYLSKDLSGTPFFRLSVGEIPNVIVLVIESLSELYIDAAPMPFLKSLTKTGIHYPNFVSASRQTHSGLHAIFCGEIPNLSNRVSKADILAVRGARTPCLPETFSRRGFRTIFMEAANMEFMRKDRIAHAMGFHELLHDPDFLNVRRLTPWGPEDISFLREVANKASALNKELSSHWFLGALTAGTHHPYAITPEEFREKTENPVYPAFRRADQALKEFFQQIERSGVRKNTLIVITSDESSFPTPINNSISDVLASNRGFLLVLPTSTAEVSPSPGKESSGYFETSDLQTSLLDLYNFFEPEIQGRSVFRDYHGGFRPLLFQEIFLNSLYVWDEPDLLYRCAQDLSRCERHQLLPPHSGGIFSSRFQTAETTAAERDKIRKLTKLSDQRFLPGGVGVILRDENLRRVGNFNFFSGMKNNVEAGHTIVWETTLKASPENKTDLRFWLSIFDYNQMSDTPFIHKVLHIPPGKPFSFIWKFHSDKKNLLESNSGVQCDPDSQYTVESVKVSVHKTSDEERQAEQAPRP